MEKRFDSHKYRLGKLCSRGHDWNGTGQSLREIKGRCCYKCHLERSKKWKSKNRDHLLEYGKQYREENKEELNRKNRQRYQENKEKYLAIYTRYYRENRQKVDAKRREWYQRTIEERRLRKREYYERTRFQDAEKRRQRHRHYYHRVVKFTGQPRLQALRRRARVNSVLHVSYQPNELIEHFSRFGDVCVYCKSAGKMTVDHVIPISKNGADALFNIVPCCRSCNASKIDSDLAEWYCKQPFFDSEQLHLIFRILSELRDEYTGIV